VTRARKRSSSTAGSCSVSARSPTRSARFRIERNKAAPLFLSASGTGQGIRADACPGGHPEGHPDSPTGGTVMRRLAAPIVLTLALSFMSAAAAVSGPTVMSLTLKPSSISGGSGATSTGTVTLSAAAPSGGQPVALASSISALAAVPPSVTVPAGQISTTFTVWTNPKYRDYSGLAFSPVISASANGGTQSATLSVSAQPLPADIQNDTADRHGDVCGGSFPA